MEWKKILLAAAAFVVISQIVHMAGALADMCYYSNPAYFMLWSPLMMPAQGPPPMDFYLFSIAFSLITGAIFAYAFLLTKASFKEKSFLQAGVKFGLFLFLISGITSTLSMYLLFAVPAGLLFSWLAQGLIVFLAFGIAMARIFELVK